MEGPDTTNIKTINYITFKVAQSNSVLPANFKYNPVMSAVPMTLQRAYFYLQHVRHVAEFWAARFVPLSLHLP